MPFVEIHAGRMHFEMEGPSAAPVLVLSASLGATLAMWEPQVAALSRRFRLLRYDARGHGRSAAPAGPYSVDDLGGDVVSMLDALEIQRAHFCGLSMGGITGLWLAMRASPRIERLIVANSAARVGTVEGWNTRMAAVRRDGMAAVIAAGLIERWFTADFRAHNPDVVASIRRMVLDAPLEGYLACCAVVRDADLRARVAEIRIPTLMITGTSDVVTPPADAEFLAAKIPAARLRELPAAHLSNVEAAAEFSEAVLQFLC